MPSSFPAQNSSSAVFASSSGKLGIRSLCFVRYNEAEDDRRAERLLDDLGGFTIAASNRRQHLRIFI